VRRPHHRAGLGDLRDPGAGDAEVGHHRFALRVDDHVLRLQVAVDDPLAVRVAGRLQHLADHRDALLDRDPGVDQLLQRRPLDVLHGDVVGALPCAAVEDRDDVRVLQPGGRLGLALEAHHELAVLGEAPVEDLQGDPPVQGGVLGEPDFGHAAAPEFRLHLVTAVDDRADLDLSHATLPS
jgi:hypothetical protein